MAEQHLSLSAASLPYLHPAEALPSPPASEPKDLRVEPSARPPSSSLSASRVGILDLALKPYDLITNCAEYVKLLCEGAYGVAPNYRIEGGSPDMTVGAIGSHLEYTLTELLKNAFRATIEHNVPKPEEKDPDEFRFEDLPHAHMLSTDFPEVLVTVSTVPGAMTIRIRDRGGGIRAPPFLCLSSSLCRSPRLTALPPPHARLSPGKRAQRLLLRLHVRPGPPRPGL